MYSPELFYVVETLNCANLNFYEQPDNVMSYTKLTSAKFAKMTNRRLKVTHTTESFSITTLHVWHCHN